MIASDCDYVNVLFKSAVDWSHKMYLESNPVVKNKLGTGFLQIACYKLHKHYEVRSRKETNLDGIRVGNA